MPLETCLARLVCTERPGKSLEDSVMRFQAVLACGGANHGPIQNLFVFFITKYAKELEQIEQFRVKDDSYVFKGQEDIFAKNLSTLMTRGILYY